MATTDGQDGSILVGTAPDGAPLARARSWRDGFFALGLLHGRDRGAQIELMRIVAQGRISERLVDNPATLELDRHFRRLRLAADAHAHIGELEAGSSELLQAYTRGVNRARGRHFPWLYRALIGAPEPLTEADILALVKLQAYAGLAEGQRTVELFLMHAARQGVEHGYLRALFPKLDELDLRAPVDAMLPPLFASEPALLAQGGGGGSNAWVVSGAHTASGKPLLANDPHLEVNRLPAVCYEARLEVGEHWVAGATLPGLPGFIAARTRDLAWGVTYSCADTCDFFVERLRDGSSLAGDDRHPVTETEERVRRRHHEDEQLTVSRGHCGTFETRPGGDGDCLSWCWVGQGRGGIGAIEAFTRLLRCTDVRQAQACVADIDIPTLNMLFADRDGNIAYQLVGAIPKRVPGWSGLSPIAAHNDPPWLGNLETDAKPALLNPAAGVIVATNDDSLFGPHNTVSNCWVPSYRQQRIGELLQQETPLGIPACQRIQYDVYSGQAALFVDEYLRHFPPGPEQRLLRDWDLRYTPDSRAATLFERVHLALVQLVFGRRFGAGWFTHVLANTALYTALVGFFDAVLLQPDSLWLPRDARRTTIEAAIRRALEHPERLCNWGEANAITLNNLFLGGRVPSWLGFDLGPYPLPGNHATVNQGNRFRVGGRDTSFAPCYRMVTDLAAPELWSNYPGGPGESRFRSGYASRLKDWRVGGYRRV